MVLAIKVMPKLLFQHLIVCPNSSFGKTAFKSMPKLLFRHVQNMSTAKFLQYMYIYISKTISFCSFGASSLILGIVWFASQWENVLHRFQVFQRWRQQPKRKLKRNQNVRVEKRRMNYHLNPISDRSWVIQMQQYQHHHLLHVLRLQQPWRVKRLHPVKILLMLLEFLFKMQETFGKAIMTKDIFVCFIKVLFQVDSCISLQSMFLKPMQNKLICVSLCNRRTCRTFYFRRCRRRSDFI